MLAYLPQAQAESLLRKGALSAYTDKTIVSRETLAAEMERIRAHGFAVDDEERTRGIRCIAAPIFNQFGEAVAGISLSAPAVRITPGRDMEYGTTVRKAAEDITRAIGGMPPRE